VQLTKAQAQSLISTSANVVLCPKSKMEAEKRKYLKTGRYQSETTRSESDCGLEMRLNIDDADLRRGHHI
jgi:hypothetical protein